MFTAVGRQAAVSGRCRRGNGGGDKQARLPRHGTAQQAGQGLTSVRPTDSCLRAVGELLVGRGPSQVPQMAKPRGRRQLLGWWGGALPGEGAGVNR